MAEHWTFTCNQAAKIVDLFQGGEERIAAAVFMHGSVVDKDKFDATVVCALFQFDDEQCSPQRCPRSCITSRSTMNDG